MDRSSELAQWFSDASAGVLSLVESAASDDWGRPGLGDWTILELVAHVRRAWTLLGTYLAEPQPDADAPVGSAASYFARGLVDPTIHVGVLARGREDALTLGPDPAATVRASASEALEVVATTPFGRLVPTRICPLTFGDFVETRAFELTVHGLDLARALAVDPPEALVRAAGPALLLLAEVAAERGSAVELLLAASGRQGLPDGFSLLG